jgi:DnaK suppressor protein
MQDMPETTLNELKDRLMALARELSSQDQALRSRLAAEDTATSNTFVAGAEAAVAAEADDEVLAMLHHEQTEAREVREALQRLADGCYGECVSCGEAIPLARLAVLPQAATCVRCQDAAEHRGVTHA